jgi:hypothetical protein
MLEAQHAFLSGLIEISTPPAPVTPVAAKKV